MRTLVSFLNEKKPQELRGIAEYWEANITNPLYSGNAFELALEMSKEFFQRRLIEKIPAPQLDLLRALLKKPNYYSVSSELSAELNITVDQTNNLIEQLEKAGIVFSDTVKVEPHEKTDPVTPPPQGPRSGWNNLYGRRPPEPTPIPRKLVWAIPRELAKPLQRLIHEKFASDRNLSVIGNIKISHLPLLNLLQRLEPEIIENLASEWGIIGLKGDASSREFVEELARAICDSNLQKRVLNKLDSESDSLFKKLKEKGRTTIEDLLTEYVSIRRLGRALALLIENRLVWEAFEDSKSVVWVPLEIAKAAQTPLHSFALQSVSTPSIATPYPANALSWDILTMVSYLLQNEVEHTQELDIPKRHMKKIIPQLWGNNYEKDFQRSEFIVKLAKWIKLIYWDTQGKPKAGEELEKWLKLDLFEQMRILFALWKENPTSTGFLNIPFQLYGTENYNKGIESILEWLSECEPNSWYSFDSFLAKGLHEKPFFGNSRREILNKYGPKKISEVIKNWHKEEGAFIEQLMGTPLVWLGIIRTAEDESGNLSAFCLTDLGAELTARPGAEKIINQPSEKPLIVLANHELMLLSPETEGLWKILHFCDVKKLDKVSHFILNRKSILRGMDSGYSAGKILEWLESKSAQPLPQNCSVSIRDWSNEFKTVQVNEVILLETEDSLTLDQLVAHKKFSGYITRRLSPTVAIVQLPDQTSPIQNAPLKDFKTKLKVNGFYSQ